MSKLPFGDLPIGLIGCGRWGRFILRDLTQLGCEAWVVADSSSSVANATVYGARHIVSKIDELPSHLKGYIVAVPSSLHKDIVIRLLDRQRPIYVEKPLTVDCESAHFLVKTAGERVFVMDKWRYHPAIEMLAGMISDGELGQVRTIRTRRVGWGNPHGDVDTVWILLPHDLSIILHLLGCLPKPRWAVGEWVAQGQMCSLSGVLGDDPRVWVEVSSSIPVRERSVCVVFDQGTAMMADPFADHVLIQPGCGLDQQALVVEKRPISTEMPLFRELRAFLAHLRGGPPPFSSATDGAIIVETIVAMREMAGRHSHNSRT
ncbi:MAG: Gfo/Idh/MocA family oxidoreductase [Candidatus Contendobacter sp.]|nr:Gfo/Idh/MocA family oxidoreductase [Candidatus Contendobacter sp.]